MMIMVMVIVKVVMMLIILTMIIFLRLKNWVSTSPLAVLAQPGHLLMTPINMVNVIWIMIMMIYANDHCMVLHENYCDDPLRISFNIFASTIRLLWEEILSDFVEALLTFPFVTMIIIMVMVINVVNAPIQIFPAFTSPYHQW